jgi:type III secretion protein V
VEVSADLEPMLDGRPGGQPGVRAMTIGTRTRLFTELGVPLPVPRVRVRPELAARQVLVSVHEVPAALLELPPEVDDQAVVGWVESHTAAILRGRAADFLGLAEVQRLLDELEAFAPATVRNVVPRPLSLVVLTDVLRRLVDERISIRDLRAILEGLSTLASTEKDPLLLAEHARAHLRRATTFRLTGGSGQLEVVVIDSILEDTVRRAITRTPAGAFLTLPPQAARDVVASVKAACASVPSRALADEPAVLLTQPDIRRFVRKLVEAELPELFVISYADLLPEVALKPVARAVP